MNPEYMCWGGWWLFPILMCIVVIFFFFHMFGRRCFRPPWVHDFHGHHKKYMTSETAIDILKKRYAKGEISKEEFEQMKRDILN
ncbi:SHOCT domain-containing protein [Candidatus Latescibacterota bacterium]